MKKFFTTTRSASALLIAILVMGILLTLTLGLSDLVIREIRQTTDLVASGKAYFAAEAGIEDALLDLHENLPGYETPMGSTQQSLGDSSYDYTIFNKADKVPYFDPNQPIFLKPDEPAINSNFIYIDKPEVTYNALPLGGSAMIPLYSDNGQGGPGRFPDVTEFIVEYYVCFGGPDQQGDSGICNNIVDNISSLEYLDILRWKIFGRPKDDVNGKTESISDFYPSAANANANNPVCMGSVGDPSSLDPNGRCMPAETYVGDGNTLFSAARECYKSDAGYNTTGGADIKTSNTVSPGNEAIVHIGYCTISDFIRYHEQNYLVLTNVINPDIINVNYNPIDNPSSVLKTNIYYRVIARNGNPDSPKLVREAASITANGYASNGQVKQSIDVKIGLSSFLPVFNFSLYHTDTR